MKKIIYLLIFLSISLNAQVKIDKEIAVLTTEKINIKIISGFIKIIENENNLIKVTGEIGKNVGEIMIDKSENGISIYPIIKEKFLKSGENIQCNLIISLPSLSLLKIQTVSGNIELYGIFKTVHFQTISGNLKIGGRSDFIECSAIDGSYLIDGDFPDSILKTTSGTIELNTQHLKRVSIFSTTGKIDVNCKMAIAALGDIKSVNSNISFGINDSSNVDIYIKTITGTSTTKDFLFKETIKDGNRVKYTNGNGDSKIVIESITGNILLKKEE